MEILAVCGTNDNIFTSHLSISDHLHYD